MRKTIFGALFLILFFVLQCTLFKSLAVGNISPNLIIILVCTYGLIYGEWEGLLMGFAAGLLCDIFFGSILGINALLYMFIGYISGKFNRVFYAEDVVLPGTLFLGSDIAYGITYYLLMFLFRGRFDFVYYLMNIIVPEAIYTLVCAVIFYPLVLLCINARRKRRTGGGGRFV